MKLFSNTAAVVHVVPPTSDIKIIGCFPVIYLFIYFTFPSKAVLKCIPEILGIIDKIVSFQPIKSERVEYSRVKQWLVAVLSASIGGRVRDDSWLHRFP